MMPDSVEQIQAILKVLNQHRIPVYPISTGKNLGYGAAAPVRARPAGHGSAPHEQASSTSMPSCAPHSSSPA
jgi:hypothetical protein